MITSTRKNNTLKKLRRKKKICGKKNINTEIL